MVNIQKNIKNEDGSVETLLITSGDNKNPLDLNKTYKLANRVMVNENKFLHKFKNSILGTEVGIRMEGFSNITILATILAVAMVLTMYVLWRV